MTEQNIGHGLRKDAWLGDVSPTDRQVHKSVATFIEESSSEVLGKKFSEAASYVNITRRKVIMYSGLDALANRFGSRFIYLIHFTGWDLSDQVAKTQLQYVSTRAYLMFMDEAVKEEQSLTVEGTAFDRTSVTHQRMLLEEKITDHFKTRLTADQQQEADTWFRFFTIPSKKRDYIVKYAKSRKLPEEVRQSVWDMLVRQEEPEPQDRGVVKISGTELQVMDREAMLRKLRAPRTHINRG